MGKFDAYKISLKGLKGDKELFEFLLDNIFFSHIEGEEVQKGRLKAVVEVKRTVKGFDLQFQIDGMVYVPCDRCLNDVEIPVSVSEKLIVKFGADHGSEGDNIIIIPEAEGDINIAWLLYEFIVLAVPMKRIHGPGKCNKSMTGKLSKHVRGAVDDDVDNDVDLENDDISSELSDDAIDPRWNELKKILDNN